MSSKRILVTGGAGFIGAALVIRLVQLGHKVRILDDFSRGDSRRLISVRDDVQKVLGDVRDKSKVLEAARGVDQIYHLAAINGTSAFYRYPAAVLEVGTKGIINVLDACRDGVPELFVASSSEVYQTPPKFPTPEDVPLTIPDVRNPRYSYAGAKIISELMALHYAQEGLVERVLIFRPHNVYGPDMGIDHVIPELAIKLKVAHTRQPRGVLEIPVQGTGKETRSFCYIDDLVAGILVMRSQDAQSGVYNIGNPVEVSSASLARHMGRIMGRRIKVVPSKELLLGSPKRRCPDISKLEALGFKPEIPLSIGLKRTLDWYWENHNYDF